MKVIGMAVLGAFALLAGATASAWAQSPQVPERNHLMMAPPLQGDYDEANQGTHTLFSIGDLGVHVWAPVEPPYDSSMNRTAAGDPAWDSGQ